MRSDVQPKTNNKMKTFLRIFIFLACCSTAINAQTVQIMDLSVLPREQNLTSAQTDSIELRVMFKINLPGSAVKAHVYFGTHRDSSDVASMEAAFVSQNNKNYLQFHGIQNEISAYSAFFYVKLSVSQYSNFTNVTLFVEKPGSQYTGRLYFDK